MAAVIIANLRRHRTDNSHAEGGDLHAIFPRYDVVHSGPLAKRAFFSGATTWNTVECAVTGSTFAMGKMGSDCLIDCIPLEEIESVRSAKAKDIDHKANNSKSAANVRLDLDLEDESAGQLMCFEISTSADGHNNGRKYQFRGSLIDGSDIQNWVSVIKAASKKARDEKEKKVVRSCSEIAVSQAQALRENRYVQLGFGIAICLSFILSVVSAEVRPEAGSVTFKVLDYCDWILTGIFVLELLVNFTADFFFTFFKSSWNLFDLVVVTGSIVASVQPSSDMNLGALRIVRVLRAVRLLNHAGSLKQIVYAMFASVLPVANSFVLLTLIMCIYATMGVNLFGTESLDQHPHYFGTFSTGLFTMFECATQDGWSEIVRRISTNPDASVEDRLHLISLSWTAVLFFVSFMIVGSIVLINIVIAVLLDEFLTTMANARSAALEEEKRGEIGFEDHSLEPLMVLLSQFRSADDLALTIQHLYERLDVDQSGTVGFQEAQEGLRKWMHIYLSKADWDEMITGETSIDGEVTRKQFNSIISHQLRLHILRSLNRAMTHDDATVGMLLPALKLMLISEEHTMHAPSQSIHGDRKQGPDHDHHQPCGQSPMDQHKDTVGVGRADELEDKAVAARLAGLETAVHHVKEHLQKLAEQTDKRAQEIASKLDLLLQRDVELGSSPCSNSSLQAGQVSYRERMQASYPHLKFERDEGRSQGSPTNAARVGAEQDRDGGQGGRGGTQVGCGNGGDWTRRQVTSGGSALEQSNHAANELSASQSPLQITSKPVLGLPPRAKPPRGLRPGDGGISIVASSASSPVSQAERHQARKACSEGAEGGAVAGSIVRGELKPAAELTEPFNAGDRTPSTAPFFVAGKEDEEGKGDEMKLQWATEGFDTMGWGAEGAESAGDGAVAVMTAANGGRTKMEVAGESLQTVEMRAAAHMLWQASTSLAEIIRDRRESLDVEAGDVWASSSSNHLPRGRASPNSSAM